MVQKKEEHQTVTVNTLVVITKRAKTRYFFAGI